jgi:hypothetical protein
MARTRARLICRISLTWFNSISSRRLWSGLPSTGSLVPLLPRCDPRAPKNLPKHTKDLLPPDPKILEWQREREVLYVQIRGHYGPLYRADKTEMGEIYKTLVRKINARTKKRDDDIRKVYRRQYCYRTHNEELQLLLNKLDTEDCVEPTIRHQLSQRTRLQEVICHFLSGLIPEQIAPYRTGAIDLMVALFSIKGVTTKLSLGCEL